MSQQTALTHNWIWQWENALSKEFCDLVIKEITEDKQEYKKGTVGDNDSENFELRQTEIKWLDQMTPIGCVMQAYANAANFYAGWAFQFVHMEGVQIGKYDAEQNSFYDWHIDASVPNKAHLQRKVSIVVMLSDPEKDFEGGEFELANYPTTDRSLLPTKGSILVFPSYMTHRVKQVTKGTRYTAVSWMMGQSFR